MTQVLDLFESIKREHKKLIDFLIFITLCKLSPIFSSAVYASVRSRVEGSNRHKFDIWICFQTETDAFYCEELLAVCFYTRCNSKTDNGKLLSDPYYVSHLQYTIRINWDFEYFRQLVPWIRAKITNKRIYTTNISLKKPLPKSYWIQTGKTVRLHTQFFLFSSNFQTRWWIVIIYSTNPASQPATHFVIVNNFLKRIFCWFFLNIMC